MSSDCFLVDTDGLGFVLARDNWDVWLGNIRGNYYSRAHNRISPNSSEFWNYSWHDMGQKDITAMIDYILNKTGKPQLNYIGHSMGTTMFYVMASTMPSYNKKINTMISLAPIGRMTKWNFVLNNSTYIYQYTHDYTMKNIRQKKVEVLPRGEFKGMSKHQILMEDLDTYFRTTFEIVTWFVNSVTGEDIFPDGTSTRNLLHYLQNIGSGTFQRFDYGSRERNMKAWGHEAPTPYNLNNIKAPVAVFYAVADEFASEKDAEYMISKLPNVVMKMKISAMRFGHGDFCFTTAKENLSMRRKMHASILNLLKQRDEQSVAKKSCQNKKDCDPKS
ncbi:lipase 1 [Nilaparvata lugens]|uniref:lipase 1 n=1 Tax=Nilaparvata lugens TaxID=108931 RepID=UPI00193E5376|nr:lipase 1 [Nilaparvata lugens]